MKYIFLSLFFVVSIYSYAQMPMDTTVDLKQKQIRMAHRGEKSQSPMRDDGMERGKMLRFKDPNLNLTAEQEQTINEHQMVIQKEINRLMAELKVKRSELNLLEMNDNPDKKKIDKTIDEIGNLMTKMMKQQSEFKIKVRSTLTPEQRVVFDNKQDKFNHRRGAI